MINSEIGEYISKRLHEIFGESIAIGTTPFDVDLHIFYLGIEVGVITRINFEMMEKEQLLEIALSSIVININNILEKDKGFPDPSKKKDE